MRILIISWFLLVLASCSGSGGGGTPQPPSDGGTEDVTLEKISISPFVTQMAVGTSVTLSATGIYSDLSTSDISGSVSWTTEDEAILVYDNTLQYGVVRATGVGLSRVRVAKGDVDALLELMVSPATLEKLTISPASVELPLDTNIELTATGFFSDQSSQDVTGDVVWTIANPMIATVANGRLTAMAQGSTTVTGALNGKDYTISITVNDATLTSVEVSPARAALSSGSILDMYVTGIYSDNSMWDLTLDAGWDSSDDSVASASLVGERLVLTGKETGQVTVTAWVGDLSATSVVTVSEAVLSRIEISAGDAVLPEGLTRQLRATGIYSDGSFNDLTSAVVWASLDEEVAVISNAWDSKGLMNALNMGTVEVAAAIGEISGSAYVTVGAAVLERLDVSAGFDSIPAGLSQNIQATGLYSDHSLRDLTSDVTWTSSDTQVAMVGNGADKGIITGITPGVTVISAHMGDDSADLAMTVSAAVLSSIEISPESMTIPAGEDQQFTATGVYSDHSTSDVTREVLWASSDSEVAVPDNSDARAGLFQALAEGAFEATAVLDGVSASVAAQVSGAELESVFMSSTAVTMEKGAGHALTVTGLYSDSSTKDLTDSVLWASEDTAIVRAENGAGVEGQVYSVAEGIARVTASINGLEAFCEITVTAAGISSIDITAPMDSLAAGTSMTLTATGHFNDGSQREITDEVLWESSDTGVAVASNASGEQGFLRTYTDGTVVVTATFKGLTDQVSITVSQATLDSIEVLPGGSSQPSGFSVQYQAIGHFSDGSEQDLTGRVVWTVSDSSLAGISNLAGLNGRLYTFAEGSLTVTATYSDSLSGTANLSVTGASLRAVQLFPTAGVVEEGQSATMVLAGLFSDDSVRDLSGEAVWLTTDPAVFTVSNAAGDEGAMTGQGAGQAYALAIYSNLGFVAPVFVIDGIGMDVEQVEEGVQFSAYGDYGADQYLTITEQVTWSSGDESVMSISNESGERGLAQVHQLDVPCQVTARYSDTLSVSHWITFSSSGE